MQRSSKTDKKRLTRRPAFLLVLVVIVIAMASLAALNFSESMLVTHETARLSAGQLQARMCSESGVQAVRLFLAYPRVNRTAMGGTWDNPSMFQALNVIPDVDPKRRGNFTVLSSSLDEFGNYTGLRYGLQSESAKVNLLTLAQLESLVSSNDLAGTASAALGGGLTGGFAGEAVASSTADNTTASLAADILMALPGMTADVADAILDYLDEDDDPRPLGAEFTDYYSQLQPAYKPANGAINSIEQLLLVRGVTPAMLFGYDENRNGFLDQNEMNNMNRGIQPGMAPGAMPTVSDPGVAPPPPLGWAAYMTIHSAEKNVTMDGYERININSDDLETLYADLNEVLGNETWASFIIAYRISGQPGGNGMGPLATLMSMSVEESGMADGAFGTQMAAMNELSNAPSNDFQELVPWSADLLEEVDLAQQGSVKFNQVLDLIDATVGDPRAGNGGGAGGGGRGGGGQAASRPANTGMQSLLAMHSTISGSLLTGILAPQRGAPQRGGGGRGGGDGGRGGDGGGRGRGGQVSALPMLQASGGGQSPGGDGQDNGGVRYSSPFTSLPMDMANALPILMDQLTTVDAPSIPGRINIMDCPQEILRGIPGLTDEVVEQILQARVDGSESETRNFETWLAIEGYLAIDEMRAILPLVTCGGDVFKAQIVGYLEGDASSSRIETVINAAEDPPRVQFYRRLDHLGRGFDITTLGQRFDAGLPGGVNTL